jgi:tryptophan-rich sensory protein
LMLYGLIFPLVLVVYFLRYKNDLENFDFQSKFGPLILPYKKLYFFWELVIMIRRTVFIVSSDFLSSSGSYGIRYSSGIALLLFFVWCDALIQPYLTREFNMFAIAWGLISCIVLLCQGLVFEADEITDAVKFSFGILVVLVLAGCLAFAIIHGTRRILKKSAPVLVTKKACSILTREALSELFYLNSSECTIREGKIEVSREGFEQNLDFIHKKEILDILSAIGKVGDRAFDDIAEKARKATQFQQNALGQLHADVNSTLDYVGEVQRKATTFETSAPESPTSGLQVWSFHDGEVPSHHHTLQSTNVSLPSPGLTLTFKN